ncbi:hypothetical protein C2S51_002975 [Perilla frutescens var. frutescens]|nr:hypothetical protein C2S51_002975 [Perilla frutescens var. frutescens]
MVSKTVEASFPSNIERSVASALLSLSSCPSVSGDGGSSPESLESTGFSTLKSVGSPDAAEVSVDEESPRAQLLSVVASASGSHDLKLKIVRKKRSKSIYISNGKKVKTSKPDTTPVPASSETISELTTEAPTCFSSNSTGQSLSRKTSGADKLRKPVMPNHMGHKAAAIMKVLSNGSTSEVMIRQLLGDSPSTSKALRMLLKLQTVKRFGAGGRSDPFIYMVIAGTLIHSISNEK